MEIPAQIVNQIRPEWLRLPGVGENCPYFGLTRDVYYRLIREGKIRSVSLRDRGKLRGVRLISYDSVSEYLAGLATADQPGQEVQLMRGKRSEGWSRADWSI